MAFTELFVEVNMKYQNSTFNRFNGFRLFVLLAVMMLSANTYAQGDSELYDCLIEPNVVASVGSPVQGVLAEALVNRGEFVTCLLYTSPSPRDRQKSRMPSSA